MPTIRRFLVAGFAAVSVAACSDSTADPSTGSPGPTTLTSPSTLELDTPASEGTFVSDRYGFSVAMPDGWSGTDATIDWGGLSLGGLGSPLYASITDPALGRYLEVGAAPVAEGMDLAAWQALMDGAAPAVCGDPSPVEETTLGGDAALGWTHRCTDGYDVNKLAALHGGRGYVMFLASPTANDEAEDRRVFDSIRSSFQFTD